MVTTVGSRWLRGADVPGAGYWLPEENPALVTAELLAFLADGAAR